MLRLRREEGLAVDIGLGTGVGLALLQLGAYFAGTLEHLLDGLICLSTVPLLHLMHILLLLWGEYILLRRAFLFLWGDCLG